MTKPARDHWNAAYVEEAVAIAAAAIDQRGRRWLAEHIRHGKAGDRVEVQIAMTALMIARGEIEPR